MNITIQDIKDRTEELGECWIWQQGTSNGLPQMKVKGCACKLVRRIVVAIDGRPAEPGQPVAVTCGEKLCVNPKHLKPSTTRAVARRAARKGAWKGMVRCARIAATKRASGKLTIEIAREIRLSEEPGPALAKKYGVDRSLITRVRAGKAWKDASNPFSSLGARP